jgi:hypothetical protein
MPWGAAVASTIDVVARQAGVTGCPEAITHRVHYGPQITVRLRAEQPRDGSTGRLACQRDHRRRTLGRAIHYWRLAYCRFIFLCAACRSIPSRRLTHRTGVGDARPRSLILPEVHMR